MRNSEPPNNQPIRLQLLLAILIALLLLQPSIAKAIEGKVDTQLSEPVVEQTVQPTAYELAVRYFGGTPMMKVIKCESRYRQYDEHGHPLVSPTHDVGIAQINIDVWETKAKELGLDIRHNTEDNLKMAKYILDSEGIGSWTCSRL